MNPNGRYDPKNLQELMKYAKIIVQSSLCPSHIRNPADAVFIIQRGAELGLSAASAIQNLIVIQGKLTLPAATAVGIAKASPECEYFNRIETTIEGATWETKRKGGEPVRHSFTQADAKAANLWGRGVWNKYPKSMLDARCSIALARLEYQDRLAGIYTPEEIESVDGTPTTPPTTPDGAEPDEEPEPETEDESPPQCGKCGEAIESELTAIRHPDAPNPMHRKCADEWGKQNVPQGPEEANDDDIDLDLD